MADHPTHQELTRRLIAFRDARDWRQFHSLKDLIVSLNQVVKWMAEQAEEREIEIYPGFPAARPYFGLKTSNAPRSSSIFEPTEVAHTEQR